MQDFIFDNVFSKPKRLIALGTTMFYGTSALILIGLVANVVKAGMSAMTTTSSTPRLLGELYPSLPSWFIPESHIAFFLVIVLAVASFIVVRFGRQLQRLLDM